MDKSKVTTAAVVAGIVGIVVGGGAGYAISNNMDNNDSGSMSQSMSEDSPSTTTKAADLRVTLNQQMRQHVELATIALRNAATNAPDTKAAVGALDANSVELSKSVGSVYGADAEKAFLELWRNHIGFFVDYTNGVVKGDKDAQQKAKDNLAGYTEDASAFFANATDGKLDQASFKKGLQTHANQVFAIVDAVGAGDFEKAYATEEEAYNHIGMAADALSAAIVAQHPEKF